MPIQATLDNLFLTLTITRPLDLRVNACLYGLPWNICHYANRLWYW